MSKLLKIKVYDLNNKEVEDLSVPSSIFGVELKTDIVAKVVNWQLSNKRQEATRLKKEMKYQGLQQKFIDKRELAEPDMALRRQSNLRVAELFMVLE